MAKGAYIGVGGVAKKVKKAYIGVGGVARKVKKAYIGVGGVARLFWSGGVDPTKDTFTEDEFLSIIADGNQALMHVGATIALSNRYCSTYEVIGVNHDGTTGTVDIMAHTQVGNQKYGTGTNLYTNANNVVRPWINTTYFNEFSESIRNAAKTMSVVVKRRDGRTETTTGKVKLLSATEIGLSGSYVPSGEGSLYTGAFTASSRWREAGTYGNTNYYVLRSAHTNSDSYVWYITSNNGASYGGYSNTYGVLPVLRF